MTVPALVRAAPWPVSGRDVAIALGYAVVAVVLMDTDVGTTGLATPAPLWPPGVSLAVLLVAAVGTLWRRSAPALTLAVTGTLSLAEVMCTGQIPAYLLLFDAVWAPIVHGSRRLAQVTTAATALAALGVMALSPAWAATGIGLREGVILALAVVAVVLATPLLWGWEVRRHSEARAIAEDLARTQRELAGERAARAVEGERRRIAQDLHDVVAGHLSAVSLHARLAASLPEEAAREASLRTAADSAAAALRDLRSVIEVLTTEGRDAAPGTTISWEDLARRLRTQEEADCTIDPALLEEGTEGVDGSVRAALLRIGTEATTNALRHGEGPRRLTAQVDGTQVRLVVENRVRAGEMTTGSGLGLTAIRDRALTVGGWASAGPVPEDPSTWRVQAVLPVRPRPERPGAEQPGAEQPGAGQPGVGQSGAEQKEAKD